MTGNKQKGLTLIEVLVALVFLSIGLIPIFNVVTSSIDLSSRIKNNLIAANLAQEGIEIVRSIRDSNILNEVAFDTGLNSGEWNVQWDSNSLIPIGTNPSLKIDNSGTYNYSVGNNTIFKRKITIVRVPAACNCELKILSEVAWDEKGVNKIITIESHLFDWK